MKLKKIFNILTFPIVLTIISTIFSINAFATGNAEFTIPNSSIALGSNVSIKLNVKADSNIGFVTGMVAFDENVLEFRPSDNASAGGGVITLNGFPDTAGNEMTFTLNFKALKNGVCKLNLTNCYITSDDGSQIGAPTAYANITVGSGNVEDNEDESSDEDLGDPLKGYLTSLTVSPGTLKPEFSHDVYDYYVDFDYSVDFCEIEGTTANTTDEIWYTGNENLAVGKNVRTVKVIDKDGNYHIYTITITRGAEPVEESSSEAEVHPEDENSYEESSSKSDLMIFDDTPDALEKYRKILVPAILIIMVTLIIAIIVVMTWLRNKNQKKNRRRRRK